MADIIRAVKNELTFENVLTTAMKTPGVKINRAKFLRKELIKYCTENIVAEAIKTNPAKAGVSCHWGRFCLASFLSSSSKSVVKNRPC